MTSPAQPGMTRQQQTNTIIAAVIAVLTAGYALPWLIAAARGANQLAPIAWVNMLLGWTIIGWIITLIWAIRSETT